MYPSAGSRSQPTGALPADWLEELDPLAARKPAVQPALRTDGGLLLPPPPPLKPKPSIVGARDRNVSSATFGVPPSAAPSQTAAADRGVVSYKHLLDEVLLPLPQQQPAVSPTGNQSGYQAATSEQTSKPAAAVVAAAAAAAGGLRPTSKPTVIRPKGRAAPTAASAAVPTAASTAVPVATLVAAPAAASAAALPPLSTVDASQNSINPTNGGAAGPRKPAPPRPAKPAPPRPTKGPSKPVAPATFSSLLSSSSSASNGFHASRSLADLEGLVVMNSSPMTPAVTTRKAMDDFAIFPSTAAGGWPQLPPRPIAGHPLYHHMISEPHAVALYTYGATQADELSFKEGDVIMLKRKVTDDWLYGSVDKREGIFPASFVSVKKDLPPKKGDVDSSATGPRCVARFDFEAEQDGDLGFVEGEVIQLVERIGLEWFRGTKRGKTGCFPAAFVEVLQDLPQDNHRLEDCGLVSSSHEDAAAAATVPAAFATAPMTASFSIDPNMAIATYDFSGRDESELTLKSGDCVYVLGKWTSDWLYGEANGTCGLFPAQFIDHIPPDLPPWSGDAPSATSGASADATGASASSAGSDDDVYVALYDFEAQAAGDLTIVAGDRVRILSRSSAEWWEGQLGSRTGTFPAAFVQRL